MGHNPGFGCGWRKQRRKKKAARARASLDHLWEKWRRETLKNMTVAQWINASLIGLLLAPFVLGVFISIAFNLDLSGMQWSFGTFCLGVILIILEDVWKFLKKNF